MAKTEKENKEKKHFWKDFKAELKRVIWPTKKQIINNTAIVIAIVLIVAIITFILDVTFEALNTYGVDKLKTVVESISDNGEVENPEASSSETSSIEESTEEQESIQSIEQNEQTSIESSEETSQSQSSTTEE